jgi:hypothetical protein
MRKRVCFGLILLACIPSLIWGQEDAQGFKGTPWGSDIHQLSGFVPVKEFRDYRICLRKGEVHQVDGVEVEEIRYDFYKDKFYAVTVRFKGYDHFQRLRDTMLRRYGAGEGRTNYMEEYEWSSKDLIIGLKYSGAQESGVLEYQFKPIFDQITRDENCCTP